MARIAFDFGSAKTTFYIKNVVVEEIFPETTTSTYETEDADLELFPNPTKDFLQLKGIGEYDHYYLVSADGRRLLTGKLNRETEKVISLSEGIGPVSYLVLEGRNKVVVRKVMRIP